MFNRAWTEQKFRLHILLADSLFFCTLHQNSETYLYQFVPERMCFPFLDIIYAVRGVPRWLQCNAAMQSLLHDILMPVKVFHAKTVISSVFISRGNDSYFIPCLLSLFFHIKQLSILSEHSTEKLHEGISANRIRVYVLLSKSHDILYISCDISLAQTPLSKEITLVIINNAIAKLLHSDQYRFFIDLVRCHSSIFKVYLSNL